MSGVGESIGPFAKITGILKDVEVNVTSDKVKVGTHSLEEFVPNLVLQIKKVLDKTKKVHAQGDVVQRGELQIVEKALTDFRGRVLDKMKQNKADTQMKKAEELINSGFAPLTAYKEALQAAKESIELPSLPAKAESQVQGAATAPKAPPKEVEETKKKYPELAKEQGQQSRLEQELRTQFALLEKVRAEQYALLSKQFSSWPLGEGVIKTLREVEDLYIKNVKGIPLTSQEKNGLETKTNQLRVFVATIKSNITEMQQANENIKKAILEKRLQELNIMMNQGDGLKRELNARYAPLEPWSPNHEKAAQALNALKEIFRERKPTIHTSEEKYQSLREAMRDKLYKASTLSSIPIPPRQQQKS